MAADDYNFQRELHCLSDPIGPAAHKDVAGKRAGYYSYSAPFYHMKHCEQARAAGGGCALTGAAS